MDLKDSIFHHFKLIKAKHKKITNFWVIWPQCDRNVQFETYHYVSLIVQEVFLIMLTPMIQYQKHCVRLKNQLNRQRFTLHNLLYKGWRKYSKSGSTLGFCPLKINNEIVNGKNDVNWYVLFFKKIVRCTQPHPLRRHCFFQ